MELYAVQLREYSRGEVTEGELEWPEIIPNPDPIEDYAGGPSPLRPSKSFDVMVDRLSWARTGFPFPPLRLSRTIFGGGRAIEVTEILEEMRHQDRDDMNRNAAEAIAVREFMLDRGHATSTKCCFWTAARSASAAAKVALAIYRLQEGNVSNIKAVGGGVMERRIDFGPGYRIYFGRDGETLVILLGGSSKRWQSAAIAAARERWAAYKRRKASP